MFVCSLYDMLTEMEKTSINFYFTIKDRLKKYFNIVCGGEDQEQEEEKEEMLFSHIDVYDPTNKIIRNTNQYGASEIS